MLINSLIAAGVISLFSLVGLFALSLKKNVLKEMINDLIALAAGVLLGGSFFHLLPEALHHSGHEFQNVFMIFILGFSFFFVLERFIHWRHCHKVDECDVHPMGMMNLIGDGVHNLVDGMLIFGAFAVSFDLGVAVSLSVALHEIPQEIGDFGVLLHAGYSTKKALFLNFLSAVTAILGVFIAFLLGQYVEDLSAILIPVTAGGFTYIAASDLIPELHTQKSLRRVLTTFLIFALGLGLMWGLANFGGHAELHGHEHEHAENDVH